MKLFISLLFILLIHSNLHAQPGISSEGREYYIALIQPSFWTTTTTGAASWPYPSNYTASYKATLMITSSTENDVTISYISNGGKEINSTSYHFPSFFARKIPITIPSVTPERPGETPEYKTLHVVSKAPISIQFNSIGAFSGGAYQPLPLQCLGKKYVVMSYHDNPSGLGGYIDIQNNPKSSGCFIIVAPSDGTSIQITPTSTTSTGNPGFRCGAGAKQKPQPFSISLNKGQIFAVRSASEDPLCDLTGTIIEANKPIAVIAGHDDANIDGSDVIGLDEEIDRRDYMIEQLIPVECFDTTGYHVIPFQSSSDGSGGEGDEIRGVCNGVSPSSVQLALSTTNILDFSLVPFQLPVTSKIGLALPATLYATNGKPFAIMMYDQRSQGKSGSGTSPSMTSIIPRSHWKSEYSWATTIEPSSTLTGSQQYYRFQNNYINVICDKTDYNNGNIQISINGGAFNKLTSSGLSIKHSWPVIPNAPDLIGITFNIGAGNFFLINTAIDTLAGINKKFVVYNYGNGIYDPSYSYIRSSSVGYSYSSPLGMVYKAFGVAKPVITTSISDNCDGWNICLQDSGGDGNGIRYIELLNYQNNTIYPRPGRSKHVTFDPAADPLGKGEIVLAETPINYCFNVFRKDIPDSCRAVIAVYDNSGDRFMIDLSTKAKPAISVNGNLTQVKDTIYEFSAPHIDSQVCGTVILKNSDPTGPIDLVISGIALPKDPSFTLTSALPKFPFTLRKSDSVVLSFCFVPKDTGLTKSTIQFVTSCPEYYTYTLQGRGTQGLINSTDLTFSDIKLGIEECKTLSVSNTGTYPFTITSYSLDNRKSFTLDVDFVGLLPIKLLPGASVSADVCFHPQEYGDHNGRIDWKTNLIDDTKTKSYSLLSGKSTKPASVENNNILRVFKARTEAGRLIIDIPTGSSTMKFELFDLLGRLAGQWEYPATNEKTISLAIPNLASGAYILRMQAGTMVKSCSVIIK